MKFRLDLNCECTHAPEDIGCDRNCRRCLSSWVENISNRAMADEGIKMELNRLDI